MGASESTANTNGGDDEEKSQKESGGSSTGGGKMAKALAVVGVGVAVGVAALGISTMLSENTDSQQKDGYHGMESPRCFKILTDGRCHSVDGDQSYKCPQDVPDDRVERKDSGYGGTLRDHRGEWVCSFRGYIGETDCFTAELRAIHEGLKLVEKFRHNGTILETDDTILESDCLAAVNWINDIEKDPSTTRKSEIVRYSSDMIKKSRDLARNNRTTIKHIYGKDAKQCARKLANLAIVAKDKYVVYDNLSQLPAEIRRYIC